LIGIAIGITTNVLLKPSQNTLPDYIQDFLYYYNLESYELFINIIRKIIISEFILILGFLSFGTQTFVNLILNGYGLDLYIFCNNIWRVLFILVLPHALFENSNRNSSICIGLRNPIIAEYFLPSPVK